MRLTVKQVTWLKVCLHLAGLLPFLWLVWAINHGGLGADPVKDIDTHSPPVRLMVLCLGDTAFNQLRIAGAGRE